MFFAIWIAGEINMPQKKVKTKGKKKQVLKTKAKVTKLQKVKPKAKKTAKKVVKKIVPKKAPKKVKPKVVAKTKKLSSPLTLKVVKAKVQPKTTIKKGSAVSGPMGVKPYQLSAKEEYMNPKQLEHFKQILLNWKEQLMEEVDRTVHHMQDDAMNFPDPIDRAIQEEGFSLELRTRDRERKLLKKIEDTITRIEENDYGYCDDCGAEIGIRRLEARPTATQCIECKTIAEIREKQIGEAS